MSQRAPRRRQVATLLALSIAAFAAGAPGSALAAKPKLKAADASVAESAATVTIDLSLSKKAKRTVKVEVATTGGTASAGSDYQSISVTAKVKRGKKRTSLVIPLIPDSLDEPDETVDVELRSKRANVGDGVARIIITDDDPPPTGEPPPPPSPPTLSLTPASVLEGTSGNHAHVFTATLSGPSAQTVTVDYATAAGSATSAVDFIATSGQLTFAPGDTAETFSVSTVGDYADEPDEAFTIALTAPVNASIPGAPHAVTISDDDVPCIAEDLPASATNLGSIAGDTGSGTLQQVGAIDPCGDSDWFRFTLTEESSTEKDLHGEISLAMAPNDSPSGGDLDLCAQIGIGGAPTCSTLGGSATETIAICVDDQFLAGTDQTTTYWIEVEGFGLAVNDYSLDIFGNGPRGSPPELNSGC